MGKDEFEKKVLCKLKLTPLFLHKDEKLIALYNNPKQKERQSLMVLSPAEVKPLNKSETNNLLAS